ncbi:protein-L-isoaspartate O-methyltransferase family protein [Oryzifoliimicrobium ureilyticus]|uniref:protein-L-isoaspartate O-methyltransferase family protein n=1 Tax=Oryzifoliimicrobium ureilyticus TaxID=3113724 RepID=UPI0030762984
MRQADSDELRAFHAKLMALASNSSDGRLERIFELVPREAFVGPGPWQICLDGRYVQTPSADPTYIYQNVLVGIDPAKGINNGEPFLHASFIGAVAPKAGETVVHIGAGAGYYTAILSMLVLPKGEVHAFEFEPELAVRSRENLRPYEGITVHQGDATRLPLPPADVIYVNAGAVAPPASWLKALKPGGRLLFPWAPARGIGLAVLITRTAESFDAKALQPAYFISCQGASDMEICTRAPDAIEARSIARLWLRDEREPDETAVAVYKDLWLSGKRSVA